MDICHLDIDRIIKQTVQNMIESGVLKPEEAEMFTEQLEGVAAAELVAVLLTSHNLREASAKRINYYPIDMSLISNN